MSSFLRIVAGAAAALTLFGCGGGSSGDGSSSGGVGTGTGPTPANVAVTVIGLNSGASFVLQDTAGDQITVTAPGNSRFPVKAGSGSSYTLSIPTQPTGEFCNIQNAAGTAGAASNATVSIGCAQVLAGGSGSIAAAGGAFTSAAADVTVPAGASLDAQTVTVTTVAPPAGVPASVVPVGAAIDVAIDQPTRLNAPLVVTLRYDASIVPDESNLAVLHYNTTTNSYEPVTILAQDTTTHSFKIASRVFSPFLIVWFDPSIVLPDEHYTKFNPAQNGWDIANFGDYFSPGGNCFGMAAYAVWFFQNVQGQLFGRYSSVGSPGVAQILAVRAFMAQSQFWSRQTDYFTDFLGDQQTAKLMKFYLTVFNQPLILTLRSNTGGHAAVVYGFMTDEFEVYDVNYPGVPKGLPFNGTSFGTYESYNTVGFAAMPSLGRTEDFAELTAEADSGFTHAQYISVTSPDTSAPLTTTPVVVSGTLAPGLDPLAKLIGYIPEGSGPTTPVPLTNGFGNFNHAISSPLLGDSTIVLLAGLDVSDQTDWYPSSDAYFFTMTYNEDSKVLPANSTIFLGKTQTFKAQPTFGTLPSGAVFQWTLTGDGAGSIGASATVISSAASITYTASATETGTDTLSVIIFDSKGKQISTGNTTVQVLETNGCYGNVASISKPGSTYSVTETDVTSGATGTIQSTYTWKGSVAFADPPFTSTANEYDVASVFTYPAPSVMNRNSLVATFGSAAQDATYVIYGSTETSTDSSGAKSQNSVALNPPLPFGKVTQLAAGGPPLTLVYSGTGTSGGGSGAGNYSETWQLLDTPSIPTNAGTFKTCEFQVISSLSPTIIDTKWKLYGYGIDVRETKTNTSSGSPVLQDTREATAVSINGAPYAGP